MKISKKKNRILDKNNLGYSFLFKIVIILFFIPIARSKEN